MAKKLLLADDSVTIQKVVGISFANEDVEILTVDNGDDALARARESAPDIVLADVVMPGRNGYEVCEAIKADPQLAHVPVLLLTGTFEAFDEDRAGRVGADGHITKPFEAQTLVDQVNRLLARAARPAPSPEPPAPVPEARPEAAPEPQAPSAEPQASPAAEGSEGDAFDFFDEDLPTPALPREPRSAPPAPEAPSEATAFELDAGESAFDFAPVVDEPGGQADVPAGEEATTVVPAPPSPDQTGDRTVALDVEVPRAPRGEAEAAGWPGDQDLDAAFDEEGLASLEVDDLEPADAAAERPTELSFDADEPAEAPELGDELDFGSEPATGRGLGDSRDPLADFEPPDAAREALLDPDADDAFAVSSSDLGASLRAEAFPEPELEPEPEPRPTPAAEPEPPWAAEPESPAPEVALDAPAPPEPASTGLERATAASDARPDLSPDMRERIHDSLEKIAWEAFADLPDTIVRQAVARIEEIAWEVIPHMAEALIREEIRRLKGEEE